MKKGNAVWLVVLVLAVVIVVWFISTYNGLVKQDELINGQWAQVENQQMCIRDRP